MARTRVLHVVGRMSRGGVETWLVQVLRAAQGRVAMDFLVTSSLPGDYDEELRRLGAAVLPVPSPGRPLAFGRAFLARLARHGPYGVVHSHLHHFSGVVLALARRAGVPNRIAHSHSDTRALDAAAPPWRRAYLRVTEALVRRCATGGFAASEGAAAALFGPRWREDGRWRIARCGLDFSPFREPAERAAVRAALGLGQDALVLGHVGRFDTCKNQRLLVEVAACLREREPRARVVLVGDGPLRAEVEAEAARRGVADRVVFTGLRPDVPRLLQAFDAFVLPSLREGLPLVGLEAQAAGRPIVLADHITRELVVVPELFTWVPVSAPAAAWAEAALRAAREPAAPRDPVTALEGSEFALSRSLPDLLHAWAAA